MDHMAKVLRKVTESGKRTFTAAYWPNPDMVMHDFGPYDRQVGDVFRSIDDYIRQLTEGLEDTLIIVSADHGLTDIKREYDLHEDRVLNSILVIPPVIEGRCASFFIKERFHLAFAERFNNLYGDDFELLTFDEEV